MDEQDFQKATRLAIASFEAGDVTTGIARFREVARQAPRVYEAHLNLGTALNKARMWNEANEALGNAHALAPGKVDMHRAIADTYAGMGKADELVARYLAAVAERPDDAVLKRNAAVVLLKLGRTREAAQLARDAAVALPNDAEAALTLSSAQVALGMFEEADAALLAFLAVEPRNVAAGYRLGVVRVQRGLAPAAIATLETLLKFAPDHVEAMQVLAYAKRLMGKTTEALLWLKRALALRPSSPDVRRDLASMLIDRGSIDATVAHYRAELEVMPDNMRMWSDYLYALLLCPTASRKEVFEAHVACGRRYGAFPRPVPTNARDPGRRLKVGYVSPDLRQHSVAYFLEPLLAAHDRHAVEAFAYPLCYEFDATSQRLRLVSDYWHSLDGYNDADAAARIRSDGIDILVDLAGHMGRCRPGIFARAPAPVQIAWLGYPDTTGVEAIGYRFTDAIVSPPGTECYSTEKLLRLPHGYHCYRAPPDCPGVAPAPCLAAKHVTFGNFSSPPKLNPELIAIWAAVMRAVPDSHMLIKAREFADEFTRDKYAAMFEVAGIARERVAFHERSPTTAEHLAQYAAMDICLDTFPYNGTTTICEALWMGVPVVTCMGGSCASRVGASVLTAAGLEDLIAKDADEFVAIAAELARDRERVRTLREGMRARLNASHLRDETGFARIVEGAYRDAWCRWCESA